jgi:hypothetical protein
LGRSGGGTWKTDTFNIVAPTRVSEGPMGWPPWASIECTDRILIYGSSKPSSLSSTEIWLKLTSLLVGLGEKLGTDLWIGQPACCRLCREPFSREQWDPSKSVYGSGKVTIRGILEIRMVDGHTWTERGKCVACWMSFPLQGVHRFGSPWLSDMSTACLWQSSHSKLMNLMS